MCAFLTWLSDAGFGSALGYLEGSASPGTLCAPGRGEKTEVTQHSVKSESTELVTN